MSAVAPWSPFIFPEKASCGPDLLRRMDALQLSRDQAAMAVSATNSSELIRCKDFWSSRQASIELSHPWSNLWMARRGAACRTPRLTEEEYGACIQAEKEIKQYARAGHSDDFSRVFEGIARAVLGNGAGIRSAPAATIPDKLGHSIAFGPHQDIRSQLNFTWHKYCLSDLPQAVADVALLIALLNIHPLQDGNGRCARAVFGAVSRLHQPHGDAYIPLRAVIDASNGGFEIRARDAERNGNWLPIIDYFISINNYILNRIDRAMDGVQINKPVAHNERISPVVAGESVDLLYRAINSSLEGSNSVSPFLSSGEAGHCLAMYDAGIRFGDQALLSAADAKLAAAVSGLERHPLSSSLYSGVTGVGFAVALLDSKKYGDLLADLDEILQEAIGTSNHPNVDIINGIAGILTYAQARCHGARPSDTLNRALTLSIKSILGNARQEYAARIKNLGVGHGLAGLLMACVGALELKLLDSDCWELVRMAYNDLWDSCIESPHGVMLPNERGATTHSRVAWCYGSLGGAAAFARSCNLFPENRYRSLALTDCAISQIRTGKHSVVDGSLCHGWAGNALLFAYLFEVLGDERQDTGCANAVDLCVDAALNYARSNQDRFPFRTRDGFRTSAGLLEGDCGAAGALVAAQSRSWPVWGPMLGLPFSALHGVSVRADWNQ